jgi:1-aminocyclopropane-1-carboxylate deaminase/D-cysteine desulfhydrase-like pyridoxal-dependent ACC family enzyme
MGNQNLPALPLSLGHYPTPLQELTRLRTALGARARLWIKRDDWTGAGFGGNKVRKLDYMLAAALETGCGVVATTGAETSNHCRATALLAASLGLECHLVLSAQHAGASTLKTSGTGRPGVASRAVQRESRAGHARGETANLYLDRLAGARIHFVERSEERAPALARVAAELRAAGKSVLEIPLGASVPLGAEGFARAAAELLAQTRASGFDPLEVVHASSSGGTQAGLLAGFRRAGTKVRVLGISADEKAEDLRRIVARILEGMGESAEGIVVDDGFTGPGYGVATPESEAALELLARVEGVILDPVYTAKAMAGFLAHARAGRWGEGENAVFWHTGGQMALFSRVE